MIKTTYDLLQKLSAIDIITNNFALAGGTSLALQIGHRKSIHLDFFSPASFDIRELEITLAADPTIHFQFISSNSSMLFCYINSIKCDFVNEPARLINSFLYEDKVRYFSIADIAAMKMHTICGRGKKKDFFDIYALLELYNWENLIDWFRQKYDEDQLCFLWRSILYFEDAEDDPDINGIHPITENWNEIKQLIISKCGSK